MNSLPRLVLLALLPLVCSLRAVERPNIVVILSDDYGWGSVGCYGATGVETPNLDRLAREGRRFTQAYAPGSVCSPTRYGLMTGRYYWRTSVKDGEVLPGNAPLHIETTRLTLGSLCREAGYRTAAFGKWHLGMGSEAKRMDWSPVLKPGPREIGFDYFFGMAANPWNGPHSFIENEEVLGKVAGQPVTISKAREASTTAGIEKQFVVEDIMTTLTQKTTGWIEQHAAEPFFVYFAPNAVHEPVAPNGRFSGSRYGRYGNFIRELDWSVGEVLATLDRLKLSERTLVIFSSDNGGVVNARNESVGEAMKAGLAINGPLRGGKHEEWEGGFREPFLVRWPGKVPAGTVSDQVVCLTDVLATLAEVLERPLPPGQAEDSVSVLRAMTEDKPGAPVRDHVVLQSADAVYAIRSGDWKLVERADAPPVPYRNKQKAAQGERKRKAHSPTDELFNLKDDVAEAHDLAATNPEVVARLKRLLNEARTQSFTRPSAAR